MDQINRQRHPWLTPPATITEATSLACLQQIQTCELRVPDLTSIPITTTYLEQGQGPTTLVLLHGFDSSLLEFRRLIPELVPHCRVLAIDLLGFGFNQRFSDVPISSETIKAHLWQAWQVLVRTPAVLVGVSMGGAAALDFCLSYPDLVQKLVLVDSAGLTNPPATSRWMFPPLDRWATRFLANPQVRQNISKAAYYDKHFASDDAQACAALHLTCTYWSDSLINFTKSGGYGSFASQLARIQQEVLLLWGRQDRILGTRGAEQFQRQLPHSRLVWLDDCGHVPHLEKPQQTTEAILAFLTNSICKDL
ncbi:alpha/beta hydrolase [Synechocystis sp. LKSZ1]|uniref:alpha/beta fold hydrolase n=1 Tax=Synechocystis sp. LKSZ1 TaxID=3144951 RepID=UPI00336BFB8A